MAFLKTNYYYIHICICICINIPKHNLYSPYNVTCVFVSRAAGLWTPKEEGHLFCSQLYSVVCSSSGTIKASWAFCWALWHARWYSSWLAHIWAVMLVGFYSHSFLCYWKTYPHDKLPEPLLLLSFCVHFPPCSLSLGAGVFHKCVCWD